MSSKMTKCTSCQAEMSTSAKNCPNCGAKNKKPILKKWWFWVLIVLVIAGIAGSGEDTTSGSQEVSGTTLESSQPVEKAPEAKKEKFELIGEIENESDEFAVYLTGVIKNNSGKNCSYVQITFNLYDKDGNQIGTALDNINNLEIDGTWKFKAMGIDTDGTVASYKLAEVTGF